MDAPTLPLSGVALRAAALSSVVVGASSSAAIAFAPLGAPRLGDSSVEPTSAGFGLADDAAAAVYALPAGVDADAVDDAVAAVLGGATPAAATAPPSAASTSSSAARRRSR